MSVSQNMWKRELARKQRDRIRRARRRRNCAITVILLAILAVIIIVSATKSNDNSKNKPKQQEHTQSQYKDMDAVENPYTTILQASDIKQSFYADSAFAGNALAETIGMYGILEATDFYAGVNVDIQNVYDITPYGSTTSVAEQFKSKRFNKVFLTFGENELRKFNATEFKEHYQALIDKLKKYQPNARIYIIGIPPITYDASMQGGGVVTMGKIKEFNKYMMSVAVDEEIYYVDSVAALGDNKDFLPKGVSADGINLNKAAVIDLLYYITEKSAIPTAQDLARLDVDDSDTDGGNTATVPESKPQSTKSPEPSPTVNVFKDSVKEKKKGE